MNGADADGTEFRFFIWGCLLLMLMMLLLLFGLSVVVFSMYGHTAYHIVDLVLA